MGTNSIISAIDKELARLQKERSVLLKKNKNAKVDRKANAKGNQAASKTVTAKKVNKRRLSAASRAKIAEAQRKRWAAVRKSKKS